MSKTYSISELRQLEDKARQANPEMEAPPVKVTDTIFIPNLFNPTTGTYGRDVTVSRLSPTEQIRIHAEAGAPSAQKLDDAKAYMSEDISIGDLPELIERAWTLVYGCVDPSFSYPEALEYLGRKDGGDIVQPILYAINSLNDRIPALASVQQAIQEMARFPVAMQQLQAAYLAGEETLQKFLSGDNETAEYVRRWTMTITAAAFSVMREQAKIQADETSDALLQKLVDFAVEAGFIQPENSNESDDQDADQPDD
jgi:hypothetical protein